MAITEIYVIRHGESIANLEHRACGHFDTPLSELGIKQAEVTANALRDIKFDKIYSSDLSRAYDTALPNARMRGMEVERRPLLREIFLGEWEYMQVDDIVAHYGSEAYHGGWRDNFGLYVIPGGEGAVACGQRITEEVKRLCPKEGGRILIVSHGAAIRTLCLNALGTPPEQYAKRLPYPSNASYTRLSFDGERLELLEYSQESHLEKIGITKVNW